MKINRTNAEMKPEDIYRLGNVIEDYCGEYYLVVKDNETNEYALVDLSNNTIIATRFETLKELAKFYYEDGDRLANATITVGD
ncbi:hypothetical protein [Ligilactobacillus equi]|uniref:Uncharacterized protein n=1 Tax=Ligilactobacillus equi DPC 6820 TaxID=1392007 RepID=V7HUD0_9LACO|nr:hypothetical protein [Ligilactobacillus equi]ETA73512.1 hypothetical protein LEQ_1207 [Ligilactobacillus equi DPC 6820]